MHPKHETIFPYQVCIFHLLCSLFLLLNFCGIFGSSVRLILKKLKIGVSVLICNGLGGNVWVGFQQWVGIGDLIYPLAPEYSGSSFPFGCGLYFGMPASTTKGGFQGDLRPGFSAQ